MFAIYSFFLKKIKNNCIILYEKKNLIIIYIYILCNLIIKFFILLLNRQKNLEVIFIKTQIKSNFKTKNKLFDLS